MYRSTAASIMEIEYGYDIQEEGQDPMVAVANEVTSLFGTILRPKPYMVDIFPFRQ
jgi:hypothetical protein